MKGRYLYLALDHKHAGIVTCVADSPTELARLRVTYLNELMRGKAKFYIKQ